MAGENLVRYEDSQAMPSLSGWYHPEWEKHSQIHEFMYMHWFRCHNCVKTCHSSYLIQLSNDIIHSIWWPVVCLGDICSERNVCLAKFNYVHFYLIVNGVCPTVITGFITWICICIISHRITVTSQWPPWRLKSPAFNCSLNCFFCCCFLFFFQAHVKENIKAPRHWSLWGNPPVTGGFPSQTTGKAGNVSIWWRHHVPVHYLGNGFVQLDDMPVRTKGLITSQCPHVSVVASQSTDNSIFLMISSG